MSAKDDIQSAVQMMTMEMRNLSNSFNHAVRNMQQTTSGAMSNVGVMAGTAQGYAASAMGTFFPPGPRPQLGFSGMPTSNQYSGGMAGHIDSGKDAAWRNWLTSAGNNEYNKPTSWWRDTLALMGKDFVDVSRQDAHRRASRNWELRRGNLKHSAVSALLAYVPGFGLPLSLGYEFIAKPLLMESKRRENEYMDWLDQTGARNVGARWSNAAEGGWTDEEQKELAGKLQGLYKGSGFKKSQFDELMTSAEQHGYFKTYDKTNVDREVMKAKKLIEDSKYVMQALHTSAEEAVKVLSDVNKMGASSSGKRGAESYISQLNKASAYSGLSPMQIHEYSVGRSDFFRGLGYNKRDATEITMQQITDYYRKIEPGKPDNLQEHLDLSARLSAAGSGMDAVDKAFLARYHMVDGQLKIDEEYDARVRREGAKIGETTTRVENLFSQIDDDALIVALNRPGFAQYMYGKDSGRAPASLELDRQRETLQAFMMQFNAENDPLNFTWEDYMSIDPTKRSSFEFGMAKNLGVSPEEMSGTIRGILTDIGETERRMEREAAGLPTELGAVELKSVPRITRWWNRRRGGFRDYLTKMRGRDGETPKDKHIKSISRNMLGEYYKSYNKLDMGKQRALDKELITLANTYASGDKDEVEQAEAHFSEEMKYYFAGSDNRKKIGKIMKNVRAAIGDDIWGKDKQIGVLLPTFKGMGKEWRADSVNKMIATREHEDLKTEYEEHSSLASPSGIQADMNTEILTHIQQQNALTTSLLKTIQALEAKVN